MADLKKVFQQFANTAVEGEAAVMDKKKVGRALKVSTMSEIDQEWPTIAGKGMSIETVLVKIAQSNGDCDVLMCLCSQCKNL